MTKTYRRKWSHKGGIIRQRGKSYQVEINSRGKRYRERASSLDRAKQIIELKTNEIRNEGIVALSLTTDQRVDAGKALRHILPGLSLEETAKRYAAAVTRLDGSPLDDAVTFYIRHHKPVGGVKTVTELLADYVAAKEKSGRRKRTITDIKCRIGSFAERFGNRHVHTITATDIEQWLGEGGYGAQSMVNFLRVLSGFFNFARKQNLMDTNPADRDHVERPKMDERLPEIFMQGQVEKLLVTATTEAPRIVPCLCVGFFAGLRTAELDGIDWSSIDFDQRLITVRPEIAKKRRQRHVEMSDNLIAWLAPHRKPAGLLQPKAARNLLDRVIRTSGVKWVRNGMRHTFASNHLAKFQDISKTALQLGHVGRIDILFNHYRNLVKPTDADAYWRITPKAEGTILAFQRTA